jgi:hypothetical protein
MIKIKNKKLTLILIAVLLLAVTFIGYKIFDRKQTSPQGVSEDPTSYSGPTDEEKAEANARKAEIVEQMEKEQSQSASSSGSKKQVKPVITNASQNGSEIFVSAYVPGIFENGGTCVLEAKKDSYTVRKTNNAFAGATTTDCAPFRISASEFKAKGDWQVTVSYTSAKAQGTSSASTLKVK